MDLKTNRNTDELNLNVTLANGLSPSNLLAMFNISAKLKKAFKEEIELRNGLKIALNEYKLKKNIKINFKVDRAPLQFAFCVSGNPICRIKYGENEDVISLRANNYIVFHLPNSSGEIEFDGKEPIRILTLHISPDYLKEFIADDFVNLPIGISSLLSGNREERFFIKGEMLPSMIIDSNQIYDTQIKGAPRRMYLEAKALELMTLILSDISEEKNAFSDMILSDYQIDKIKEVKSIILTKIANPPSLHQLSEMSGMSHTKLNKAFKQLFGNTVFGYLREQRLDLSRELLESNKFSITQITYEAGWSNPSHFTREFVKVYNMTPKDYRKEKHKI